jgi:hypothetical protein
MSTMTTTEPQFTAYRFTKQVRRSDCAMTYIALCDNGFTPTWAREAQSRSKPQAERALLIQLPKSQAQKFREYRG